MTENEFISLSKAVSRNAFMVLEEISISTDNILTSVFWNMINRSYLCVMVYRLLLTSNVFLKNHFLPVFSIQMILLWRQQLAFYKENIEKAVNLSWSPTVDKLEKGEPTKELQDLLRNLSVVGKSHHCIRERKIRVVKSLADNIMYNTSNGQFLTLKHCSIVPVCSKLNL